MDGSSVEKRAARVAVVTGLSTAVSVVLQLTSVPICLYYWGSETYGMWLALFSASMLLQTVDAGFVSYVGNKLNLLYHQNQAALRETLASSLAGVAVIGLLQLLLVSSVSYAVGIEWLLGRASDDATKYQASLALLVLIGTWVLSGPYIGIVHRLLVPTGMMYQAAWWSMGYQTTQFVGIMLAAALRLDLLQTSVLFAFVRSVVYFASAAYIRSKLPAYYPWWHRFRASMGIKDLGNSLFFSLSNIFQQGVANGLVMLVSALYGAAMVPAFTTVRTLANLWTNVTNVLTAPLLPDIVRYHANREGDKLIATTQAHSVLVGSAVNLGILASYPFIGPLYGTWTNHAIALDRPLLCLLLASIALANAGALMNMYLNGINNLKATVLSTAGRGLLSLVFGGVLLHYLGLAGLGLGILAGELFLLSVIGGVFVRFELAQLGSMLPKAFFGPISVSTASVLIFLGVEASGASTVSGVYPASFAGVVFAAFWGWRKLESGVRHRLEVALDQWVGRKLTA